MKGHHIVVLHAFIKKTQKIPKQEISLAKLRKAEVERNGHSKFKK
ncbi:type II toxin-antitoxin system RelE/ParE family toxin [Legionella sp.]